MEYATRSTAAPREVIGKFSRCLTVPLPLHLARTEMQLQYRKPLDFDSAFTFAIFAWTPYL